MTLTGQTILITGAARRIGRYLAERIAQSGGNIIVHYGHSGEEAMQVVNAAEQVGVKAWALQADLVNSDETVRMFEQAQKLSPITALINSAAIFEPLTWSTTSASDWQRHMDINLLAPFLLSKAFASTLPVGTAGRIINLLDWRSFRPGTDHLPYTISKAGLAALTQSLALAFAPQIPVNGIALGAILPPVDNGDPQKAIVDVPWGRWAKLEEVWETVNFLLTGPSYITGEIIYLDGGRHLI